MRTDLDRMLAALATAEERGRLRVLPSDTADEVTDDRRVSVAQHLLVGLGLPPHDAAPTEAHCARCTSFAPDCPYCQTAQADLARATSDHGAVEQRWVPMEASRRLVATCSDCSEVIPAGESHACRWIGTTS